MNVSAGGRVPPDRRTSTYEAAGLTIHVQGFAYVRGCRAGEASIARFAERAVRDGVAAASADLRGLYLAAVEAPARAATYAFVDPSGFFHAFWSADGASDDFLELARAGRRGATDLDPEAVAELITQGQVAFGRTLFPSIRRLGGRELVRVPWGDADPEVVDRPLPALAEPPDAGLVNLLAELVPSLEGQRISLDLTGGIDSRLLAVILAELGVPFETATVGTPPSAETRIAAQVAAALGRTHHITRHRPEALADELDGLLRASGGLVDPLISHRELQLQRERAERGVDLVLHGAGGESFKDFFWQQDFPRYATGAADLERLWRMRMRRSAMPAPLAGDHARAAEALAQRAVERLEAYRLPVKTQTYDRIYFEVRARDVAGRALTLRSRIVPTYAPLAELDLQRLAFALPRRARLFGGLHRRTMTALDPSIARIPTTDAGMTASSRPTHIPQDAVRWTGGRAVRLARKIGLPGRSLSSDSPLPPLSRALRALPELDAATEELRAAEILRADATADALADEHLGGVVALAHVLRELKS